MGIVIRLPRIHARASSLALNPKTVGEGSLPNGARASRKRKKFSCEILPRARQLLTAEGPTPANAQAAASPPSPSITSSTELSMPPYSSRNVNLSSVDAMGIETAPSVTLNGGMAESLKSLARRLKITREAIGLPPADVCRLIKVTPSAWSMYESGERRITLNVANKLCDEFGLSLDWIYRNNPAQLSYEFRMKMQALEKAQAA